MFTLQMQKSFVLIKLSAVDHDNYVGSDEAIFYKEKL